VLRSVSMRVSCLTDGDMAGVLSPSVDDEDSLTIVSAVGGAADDVEGVRVPLDGTHVGAAYRAAAPRLITDISLMPVHGRLDAVSIELTRGFGPTILVPLGTPPRMHLLAVLRRTGRAPFTMTDLTQLSAFSTQAAVALELAHSQQRGRQLQRQADRDRIARDLHDHVVQRIFATALSLDRLGRSLEPQHADVAARLSRSVDDLHGTIVRIRTSIFELHDTEDTSSPAVRGRLDRIVRSVIEGHDLGLDLRIRCERDNLPPDLVLDLVAVVRELVTNVVRHAQARRVTVSVDIAEGASVVVTDDGCGLPPVTVRSGLANLAARAERRDGALTATSRDTGTEIRWAVPLPG
jgi:signal transduction histidine kinase